jgi:hypothetical protein
LGPSFPVANADPTNLPASYHRSGWCPRVPAVLNNSIVMRRQNWSRPFFRPGSTAGDWGRNTVRLVALSEPIDPAYRRPFTMRFAGHTNADVPERFHVTTPVSQKRATKAAIFLMLILAP